MSYRNLEAVRFIIKEATGLDVMYAYEDLVFPEHAAFMIQFDDKKESNFYCYFHTDCDLNDKHKIFNQLEKTSADNKYTLENKGRFLLKQKGEEIEIQFNNGVQ